MIITLNLLLFFIILFFQTGLMARVSIFGFEPNIILIFILAYIIFRKNHQVYLFSFLSGFLLDTISGGPFGFFTILFLIISFSSGIIRKDENQVEDIAALIFMISSAFFVNLCGVLYIAIVAKKLHFTDIYFLLTQTLGSTIIIILASKLFSRLFRWENKYEEKHS